MRFRSCATGVLILGLSLSTAALGTPEMQAQFTGVCKPKPGSTLMTAGCTGCHVKMGEKKLNLFGADVKAEMDRQKSKKLTPAVWKKVASRDSDRDKAKNSAEVSAGTLPADPKSKP